MESNQKRRPELQVGHEETVQTQDGPTKQQVQPGAKPGRSDVGTGAAATPALSLTTAGSNALEPGHECLGRSQQSTLRHSPLDTQSYSFRYAGKTRRVLH